MDGSMWYNYLFWIDIPYTNTTVHSQATATVTLVFYVAHINQFKAAEKDQSGHKLEQKTLFMYHMPKIQGRNKYELRERIDFEWDKMPRKKNQAKRGKNRSKSRKKLVSNYLSFLNINILSNSNPITTTTKSLWTPIHSRSLAYYACLWCPSAPIARHVLHSINIYCALIPSHISSAPHSWI